MSYESGISHTYEKPATNKQKTLKPIPEKPSSPSMFDEDIFSVDVYSHNGQQAFNQVRQSQKSQDWIMTPKSPSNADSPAVVLSMSPVEYVTTCPQCDKIGSLNGTENIENHNRTISDITQTMIYKDDDVDNLEAKISPKRARLDELSGIVKGAVTSTNSCDFLSLIEVQEVQSRVINDQLASLHEESAKHSKMVNYINGAADN